MEGDHSLLHSFFCGFPACRDPDNVVLCLLATDDEEDVALQIHFTLIQAFCCENDINILRVGNMRRLAEILGGVKPGGEPMDVHCVLVTVSIIPHPKLWASRLNRVFKRNKPQHASNCFAPTCRTRSRPCGRTRRWARWTDSAGTAAAWISGCRSSTCRTDETAWNIVKNHLRPGTKNISKQHPPALIGKPFSSFLFLLLLLLPPPLTHHPAEEINGGAKIVKSNGKRECFVRVNSRVKEEWLSSPLSLSAEKGAVFLRGSGSIMWAEWAHGVGGTCLKGAGWGGESWHHSRNRTAPRVGTVPVTVRPNRNCFFSFYLTLFKVLSLC